MQAKHVLFAIVTASILGCASIASAQGPGGSGAAATIPESDVRPSLSNTPGVTTGATNGATTEPSTTTVGRDRNGAMTAPRSGMTNESTTSVGTSNPQNSTSR